MLPEEGFAKCAVHLKAAGYKRCPGCKAWLAQFQTYCPDCKTENLSRTP